ncbi:MAG: hypothetical protein ACP5SG_01040 [Dissulfurimicrobium sp.]|uniref:hypothetical protein n=1 Tax=Dissulfurimicrobium sp. TaxID=2022436 RepID=UPI003D0F3866
MKKIFSLSLSLVAALMLAMWSSQAGAITLGTYEAGALVPLVIHNGSNVNTVVGITLADGTTAGNPQTVCWAFFNFNSMHITNRCFTMTSNDMYLFNWQNESGIGLANTEGYIAFTVTSTAAKISANAFMVDSTTRDAIYVPVLPLKTTDMINPGTTAFEVISAANGSAPGNRVDIRYWIDPAYQATTAIKIWSVGDMSKGQWNNPDNPAGAIYPLVIYDNNENRKSVNFYAKNAELNTIDPSKLQGLPTNFIDGFVRFYLPTAADLCTDRNDPCTNDVQYNGTPGHTDKNNMLVFSYVDSNLIGAAQTMLAGEGSSTLLP